MNKAKKKLDIIIPVFNEEKSLPHLIKRITKFKIKNTKKLDISIIFINDGSTDNSLHMILGYTKKNKFIKLINFSRNFGHQIAITAGINSSSGDYIAIIDADLQDPPELIDEMINSLIKQKVDVIYGKRSIRKGESLFKKLSAKIYYRLINKMTDFDIPTDTGDFRVITKKVVKELRLLSEHHRFVRGLIPWIGFKSKPFYYERDKRYAGVTHYPFKKMIAFALNSIFSFSTKPILYATNFGLFLLTVGFFSSIYLIYLKLFTENIIPGLASILVTIVFFSGINLLMFGLLGTYVAKIYEEVKDRPLYIIDRKINF